MGWTEERVELLKKLWLEGLSASQIAACLEKA
jgi:GcrA cell cycle regulator